MESRPRRSDATRAAIRTAARERFAADGYDRATIRAIAADARIDPAMVMRYFGSKEQLFAAAADFDLQLPDPAGIPRSEVGPVVVAHFVARWSSDDTLVALLRAAATRDGASERVRSIFAGQIGPFLSAVTAPGAGEGDVDAPGGGTGVDIRTRAGLVATQMLGFAYCRYVLELPPVMAMSDEDVVAWLGPTVQRYVTA